MSGALALDALGILLDLSVKITLIFSCAFLATGLSRRAAASVRQMTWNLAFTGVLFLPLLAMLLPGWSSKLLPSAYLGQALVDGVAGLGGACAVLIDPTFSGLMGYLGLTITTPWGTCTAATLAFAAWSLGAGLLLTKALLESLALHLGYARAEEVDDPHLLAVLQRCTQDLDLPRTPRMAFGHFGTPATFGWIHPKVVLPIEALTWSQDRLRVVLRHELAHIKHMDYLFNLAAQVVCALLWHNPLVWLAARAMRLERECAADNRVLGTGETRISYAQHLFEIAANTRQLAHGNTAVAMAHDCPLKTRVARILDPGTRRGRLAAKTSLLLGLFFLALLIPIAAMQPPTHLPAQQHAAIPDCEEPLADTLRECERRLKQRDRSEEVPVKKPCAPESAI